MLLKITSEYPITDRTTCVKEKWMFSANIRIKDIQ